MPVDGSPGGGGAYLFTAISHQGATDVPMHDI